MACLVLAISPGTGRCAEPGDSLSITDTSWVTAPDSVAVDTTAAGVEKGHWVGFPIAFYTPETGFGGGLALGYLFPSRGDRHPSSIMGISFYTEKKQAIIGIAPELYLESGFHGMAGIGYQKFPDSYWGIGPDTRDSDEERYTPEVVQANLLGEFEVYPGLRVGGQFLYRRELILETEDGGVLEEGIIPGSTSGTTAGAGIIATYDSRDNRFSSERGWYLALSHVSYGRVLLSDYDFTSLGFDARKFFPVFNSHVFATRFYTRTTTGTVPFQDMPYLGGPNSMRGYQAGRYKDKFAAYAQAEYRVPFIWVTWLAVFGSVGNVSRDPGSYSFDSIKYTGGGGVRFRLNKEGFSIRLDYAVTGEGGSNFYFSANEAF